MLEESGAVIPLSVAEPDGGARAPLVVHIPHGGTHLPAEVRRSLLVDDDVLAAELLALTDHLTPRLFAPAAVAAGGVALVNRLSRLVVDPERLPDSVEPMAAHGLGAVYVRTTTGARLREERHAALRVGLIDAHLEPWAARMTALVGAAVRRHGRALVVDGHSYPSAPLPCEDPSLPRPEVCLGAEEPHEHPELLAAMAARCRDAGLSVARDVPYRGAYVPLDFHGRDRRVRSVMVELRRDTHLDEATGEPGPGFAAVRDLVADLVALAGEAAAAGW